MRYLIRVNENTRPMTKKKTNIKTKTMTKTKTFSKHPQRANIKICDLLGI